MSVVEEKVPTHSTDDTTNQKALPSWLLCHGNMWCVGQNVCCRHEIHFLLKNTSYVLTINPRSNTVKVPTRLRDHTLSNLHSSGEDATMKANRSDKSFIT